MKGKEESTAVKEYKELFTKTRSLYTVANGLHHAHERVLSCA